MKDFGTIEQNLHQLEIHLKSSIIDVDYESTALLLKAYPNFTQPNLNTVSGDLVSKPL